MKIIITKENAIVWHIIAVLFFICTSVLLAVLCTGESLRFVRNTPAPDIETIRAYALASDAYAQGRFAETTEILRGVKKFSPALILRAKAEYFSGDFEKAEKSCRAALKYRPSSFEAKLYLARIHREKGNLQSAMETIESLLADNPQDVRALFFASELADEAGKNNEAIIFLDKAAELSAENALVLLDRARFRWVAGRGAEALEDLSRAKAMLPWDTPLTKSIINLENRIKEIL